MTLQHIDLSPEPAPIIDGHLPSPGQWYVVSLRNSTGAYEGHVMAHSATEALLYQNYVRKRTPDIAVKVKRFV